MSVSGICPVGMSLGVFPKGVYPMEYVGALGYVERVSDHGYVQGNVYWCMSKGGMTKYVCMGL